MSFPVMDMVILWLIAATFPHFRGDHINEGLAAHRRQIAAIATPQGDGLVFFFFVADNKHIRDFGNLRFPDFIIELLVTQLLFDAHPGKT